MIARNDRKILISRNESLMVTTTKAKLTRMGKKASPSRELQIVATPKRQIIRIQAEAKGTAALKVTSSSGDLWETTLFPGTNLIDFIVVTQPPKTGPTGL